MKKLRLDRLKVESFATDTVVAPRGTVQARQSGEPACGGDSFDICTYDIQACGDTRYIDCTMACTLVLSCPPRC